MKRTFEDFLMDKHAEQYTGLKHAMVDDSADWIAGLDSDDFIKYGDQFAKEQSKDLLEACIRISKIMFSHGNLGDEYQFLKQAIKKAEEV